MIEIVGCFIDRFKISLSYEISSGFRGGGTGWLSLFSPLKFSTPYQPKGFLPLCTISKCSFWLKDSKTFLYAPLAPICSKFAGRERAKRTLFFCQKRFFGLFFLILPVAQIILSNKRVKQWLGIAQKFNRSKEKRSLKLSNFLLKMCTSRENFRSSLYQTKLLNNNFT